MAYKITKYRGKHKIKDTKTGESMEIDIEKYMQGGGKGPGDRKKPKSKELTDAQVQDVRDTTGVQFTDEGARSLFETIEPMQAETVPELNLGRFKDVGYFNVNYNNGEFTVSPTKRNPGNIAKHKEYLDYIQEQNPNLRINRRANQDGYLPFAQRLEYGGKITTYNLGGLQEECPPGDIECQEQQRNRAQTTEIVSQEDLVKNRDAYLNKLENFDNAENFNLVQGLNSLHNNPSNTTTIVPQDQLAKSRQDFINQQQGITPTGETLADDVANQGVGVNGEMVDKNKEDSNTFTPSHDISDVAGTEDLTNSTGDKNFNLFNPYAGVDIPTAAYTLGRSIKDKNTLGTVGSSLKLATGLGRNIVSGLGDANRYNQVMEDYYEEQKKNRNPVQTVAHGGKLEKFAYGGKKDEELVTGEYMHGVLNEGTEPYNAEIEAGEYFQSNEGDISQVVGDKHSQGGEKIQMEEDDRVLSDQLKLGKDKAKMLSEKYDLKLKAKDTYSTVLDRFRTKSKLGKIIKEEAEVMKMIGEQDKVEDATTRNFNLEILAKKKADIDAKKDPIEEQRKVIFDELFDMQEASKPKEERAEEEEPEFAFGGDLDALAKEYNIPLERAQELVKKYNNGGPGPKKKGAAFKDVPEGQSVTQEGLFGSVTPQQFERFKDQNQFWFNFDGFDPSSPADVKRLQSRYNELTDGNPVRVDGKFGEQTASLFLSPANPPSGIKMEPLEITADLSGLRKVPVPPIDPVEEPEIDEKSGLGAYLFPDESPLPPSALQGTIKPERRFDRVRPTEIEVEPYLQDIRDREATQIQNLEGLSPNVRAAVLANVAANNQSQESNIRNQIDTQNAQSQEKAIYTNAQIQRMEENASEADRLAYEQRQYRAQALTDFERQEYFNQLQALNKQRFMDIHNLNLINATNEDVYFDGQNYRRKNTDDELFDRATRNFRRE